MKIYIFILIWFLFIPSSLALSVKATPAGGIYNSSQSVVLKPNEPEAKIMWTTDPTGPLDDTFVYEQPIPINFSTELWFFAFNDEQNITPFQKEKYIIRKNPNRYSNKIIIEKFAPYQDFIILTNIGDRHVYLNNWNISSRQDKYQFTSRTVIMPNKSLKIPLKIGDVLDKITLQSPDLFYKEVFRYKVDVPDFAVITRKNGENNILKVKR